MYIHILKLQIRFRHWKIRREHHTCTYLIHTSTDLHIHTNIDHYESSSQSSVKTSPCAYPYIHYLYIKQYIPNLLVQICIFPWTSFGRFRPAGGILFKSPKPRCTYCRLHIFCTHTRSFITFTLHTEHTHSTHWIYALYIYIVTLDDSSNGEDVHTQTCCYEHSDDTMMLQRAKTWAI